MIWLFDDLFAGCLSSLTYLGFLTEKINQAADEWSGRWSKGCPSRWLFPSGEAQWLVANEEYVSTSHAGEGDLTVRKIPSSRKWWTWFLSGPKGERAVGSRSAKYAHGIGSDHQDGKSMAGAASREGWLPGPWQS